jgi:GT2 family glycosyltransferase
MWRSDDQDIREPGAIRDTSPYKLSDTAPVVESPVSGWVNYASWLSDDLILIVGWFPMEGECSPSISLVSDARSISLETRCMSYHRPDLPDTAPGLGKVVTARFLDREDARGPLGTTMVCMGDTTLALGPLDLAQALTVLPTLIGGSLSWCDSHTRAEVMAFLASALTEHETTNGLRLSKNLSIVREALRTRLRLSKIAKDEPQGLHVDTILAIDERSFYVKGWMRDEEAEITRLKAVSPEGSETEILDHAYRYPRPDVEQFYVTPSSLHESEEAGFIAYFEMEAPSRLPGEWVFQLLDAGGAALEVLAPKVVQNELAARDMMLRDLIHERVPGERLTAEHIFPAIDRIQERLKAKVEVRNIAHYGMPNQDPEVSIIIPLYMRIDLLEQQLAQFVHDPEIRQAELIYVLDSPELASSLASMASQLFELYRVPFSVITLERNSGFSAVNNIGASFARGRLLVLLNSDVLPDKPGWLGKMREFYDSTPGIGALGPKLLYEDDSLQHAGIYFTPLGGTTIWENRHFYKGLHRCLPAANVTRRVPAVTAACMMIDRSLYQRVDGLRGVYVQGDYEDSDLCLRLSDEGFENWYLPEVELYHLEGQSYALETRQLNAKYNTWLHTHLWKDSIEAVVEKHAMQSAGDEAHTGTDGEPARTSSPVKNTPNSAQGSARKMPSSRTTKQRGKPKSGSKARKRE